MHIVLYDQINRVADEYSSVINITLEQFNSVANNITKLADELHQHNTMIMENVEAARSNTTAFDLASVPVFDSLQYVGVLFVVCVDYVNVCLHWTWYGRHLLFVNLIRRTTLSPVQLTFV